MKRKKVQTRVLRDRHAEWTADFFAVMTVAVKEHGPENVLNPHTEDVYKRCAKELTSGPPKE